MTPTERPPEEEQRQGSSPSAPSVDNPRRVSVGGRPPSLERRNPDAFTNRALQELVCQLGSLSAANTALGLPEQSTYLSGRSVMRPAVYAASVTDKTWFAAIGRYGTPKRVGQYFGVSESFVRSESKRRADVKASTIPEAADITAALLHYQSTAWAARMLEIPESKLRTLCDQYKIDITRYVTYTEGNHSTHKGRRGELEYARLRQSQGITVTDKNADNRRRQAPYDFDDPKWGRVNVKSARRQTRAPSDRKVESTYDRDFWTISTRGLDKCDYFAVLAYDRKGWRLLGWCLIKVSSDMKRTLKITRSDLLVVA